MRKKTENISHAETLFIQAERLEEAGDFKGAFTCLLASAELGDTGSQVNLGNFYASGKGVRKDFAKAAYWYRRAYRGGERVAAHNLAIDRRNQDNVRSAIVWLKRAIAMEDGDACIELAKIYLRRKRGRNAARKLLKRALRFSKYDISQAGREEAEKLLGELSARSM